MVDSAPSRNNDEYSLAHVSFGKASKTKQKRQVELGQQANWNNSCQQQQGMNTSNSTTIAIGPPFVWALLVAFEDGKKYLYRNAGAVRPESTYASVSGSRTTPAKSESLLAVITTTNTVSDENTDITLPTVRDTINTNNNEQQSLWRPRNWPYSAWIHRPLWPAVLHFGRQDAHAELLKSPALARPSPTGMGSHGGLAVHGRRRDCL
jgi:hypothetical protein